MEEESTDILIKNKDEDEKNISAQKELEQQKKLFIYGISTAVIICLIWLAYLFYCQLTEEYGGLLFLFIWVIPLLGVLISSVFWAVLSIRAFLNNRSSLLHYYIKGCLIAFTCLTILSFAFCAILPYMSQFLK